MYARAWVQNPKNSRFGSIHKYFIQERAPMGLVSSGDIFCQRTDAALVEILGMQELVDDILVVGRTKS